MLLSTLETEEYWQTLCEALDAVRGYKSRRKHRKPRLLPVGVADAGGRLGPTHRSENRRDELVYGREPYQPPIE